MMEQTGIDYEVFVDCTPLHDDVPNDPVLEAMQNNRRRLKSFEEKRSQFGEASVKPPLIYLRRTPEEDCEKVPSEVSGQLLVGRAETKAGPRRRRHAARPPWLPHEWRVEKEPRPRGRKAGCLDSFFVDPKGNRFRSKKTVLRFLETGVLPRRTARKSPNPPSEMLVVRGVDERAPPPARRPASSSINSRDFANLPEMPNWVPTQIR